MRSEITFKALLATAVITSAMMAGGVGSAQAKGCIKGAVVGGVAGHMAHHGVLGAAGGCAVGHHMASKKQAEREQRATDDHQQQTLRDPSR